MVTHYKENIAKNQWSKDVFENLYTTNIILKQGYTCRNSIISFEMGALHDYYYLKEDTLVVVSKKPTNITIEISRKLNNECYDIQKLISNELERKTQQRKDYEQDIVRLKNEVNRLLNIENYLMELRNGVLDDDFREKGDKLILNCKYKKY